MVTMHAMPDGSCFDPKISPFFPSTNHHFKLIFSFDGNDVSLSLLEMILIPVWARGQDSYFILYFIFLQ